MSKRPQSAFPARLGSQCPVVVKHSPLPGYMEPRPSAAKRPATAMPVTKKGRFEKMMSSQ